MGLGGKEFEGNGASIEKGAIFYSGYCTKVFETVEEGLLLRVERDERLSERAC